MAGAPKPMRRVEAETKDETSNTNTLLRDKCGRALVRCEGCNKSVAVALRSMHNCSLDAKIRVNLEAQAVETQTEATPLLLSPFFRKKSASDEPKRPLTAFAIFMNEFRKNFRKENPGSNVRDVPKQGAEKWKSMTEEEKKVYLDKAAELKAEYNKSLENNDADDEEGDEEKQSDDVDVAEEKEADEVEEKQSDDADEAEEKEVEKKEA